MPETHDPMTPPSEDPAALRLVDAVRTALSSEPDGIDYWALHKKIGDGDESTPAHTALMGAIELVIAAGGAEWGHPTRWNGDWLFSSPGAWQIFALPEGTVMTRVIEDVRPTAPRPPRQTQSTVEALMDRVGYRVVGEDSTGKLWILSLANSGRPSTVEEAVEYLGRTWSEPILGEDGDITSVGQVTIGSVDIERNLGGNNWLITDRLVRTSTGTVAYSDVMRQRLVLPPPTPERTL